MRAGFGEKSMAAETLAVSDLDRSRKLLKKWLTGSLFHSFRFEGCFILEFCLGEKKTFEGNGLPEKLVIWLIDDWWFGDETEWAAKVKSLGTGVDPDLPVKGHMLTELCWSTEGTVAEVSLDATGLNICFENGKIIHTRVRKDEEYTFWVSDIGPWEVESKWSIVQDFEGTHVRTPPKQANAGSG